MTRSELALAASRGARGDPDPLRGQSAARALEAELLAVAILFRRP